MGIDIDGLIGFLSDPKSYPHENAGVELVQTHASVIAIGNDLVYKVKKPVNFEFMDFSTLEKRKFYCDEEVRLNRRLTYDIYLGIVPIYLSDQGVLTFENKGVIVDYAVKMRRMKDAGFLSNLVEGELVEERHFQLIIDRLCSFYNSLGPQDLNAQYGTPDSIAYIINENTQVRREYLNKTLDPFQEELISGYQQQFLIDKRRFLEDRVFQGWVKDTHGDLRLEHFYFENEGVEVFDCIEFKERLRVNDLVNDYGFLCMELDYAGYARESDQIYSELIKCTGDRFDEELLTFYKTHRACVRGMVHAVAAYAREVTPEDQLRNNRISRKFFGLATRYVMLKDRPTVFAIYGGVATGKSTLSGKLAEILDIPHIQSDATRKEIAGLKVDEYPDDETRERLYTKEMTKRTYGEVIRKGQQLIEQHRAVILDGRWSKDDQKQMLIEAYPNARIFWIQTVAPLEEREKRLKEREKNKSISDARLNIFKKLLKDETYGEGNSQALQVDSSQTIGDCVKEVFRHLEQFGREPS